VGAAGFFPRGQIQGCKKADDLRFSVVTFKTHVFAVTILMHKTLYKIFRGGASALKHFFFFEGAPVFVEGGRAPVPWHNGTSLLKFMLLYVKYYKFS